MDIECNGKYVTPYLDKILDMPLVIDLNYILKFTFFFHKHYLYN